jgi:parallel beta-helix repeat protein
VLDGLGVDRLRRAIGWKGGPPMRGAYLGLRYPARLVSAGVMVCLTFAVVIVVGADSAHATHVNCGDTITTDTVIDSDLIDCPNNGIIIGADGITLDLNGHIIDGDDLLVDQCPPDEFCDVGVANDGHNGVRITNGTVREFGVGAFLFAVRRNVVTEVVTVEHVFSGLILGETMRTRIRSNVISRNAGPDSGVGITLFASHNNWIADNTIAANRELGIHLIRSSRNFIGHNRVRDTNEDGILVEGRYNRVVANRLVESSIGITTFGSRTVGNVVRQNVVRRPERGGIYVDVVPEQTVFKRNHVFRADASGIFVGSPGTRVTGNEARNNGRLGIKAVQGVIDGGGNRASGNGDPRQCVNIECT